MITKKPTLKERITLQKALALKYTQIKKYFAQNQDNLDIDVFKIQRTYESIEEDKYLTGIVIFLDKECRIKVNRYFICGERKGKKIASCAFVASQDLNADLNRLLTFLGYQE